MTDNNFLSSYKAVISNKILPNKKENRRHMRSVCLDRNSSRFKKIMHSGHILLITETNTTVYTQISYEYAFKGFGNKKSFSLKCFNSINSCLCYKQQFFD